MSERRILLCEVANKMAEVDSPIKDIAQRRKNN
jgi:hypothetical protein